MYKKSKDINIIIDQFQQWMDNVLRKECGRQDCRTFHYSLQEFSGFVPYFLGQDIGVRVGRWPSVNLKRWPSFGIHPAPLGV